MEKKTGIQYSKLGAEQTKVSKNKVRRELTKSQFKSLLSNKNTQKQMTNY